jgi:plasmid segregation protein ParM
MKTLTNTKIIGIDHGYGNIKTANIVTPTGIAAYDTEPVFAGNILKYGDTFYCIGEGHKSFVADKATDNDFYVFTLAAIAQELHQFGLTGADVHIAAGLPLTWVKTQREDFRSYLLQNKSVQFEFNNVGYKLNIVGCSIYPQGYPAIIDRLGEMSGVNPDSLRRHLFRQR